LEEFEIDVSPDRTLFGLPAGTAARVIEGINRYAGEVPIVFGAAIEGSSDAPALAWEAPLLEIAREGLMMAGRRELNRTIEELGHRIDGLGGVEGIPLDTSFKAVQQQAESAARSIIEEAGGGFLQDLPVIGDLAGDASEDGSGDVDAIGLPGLLENLLDSLTTNQETDNDGAASSE
ncbi:hypothetical protein KAJ02_04980, partial [Candidatus Bipolaricaulota bacterium]|nr:hypothetical protein [Candidatus Bipolaricaulota bacterium]